MNTINEMHLRFPSNSSNEGFARGVVASFILPLDPTVNELADIRTAVSEAVTNAVVHGYRHSSGTVYIDARITDTKKVIIKVRDRGVGIEDVEQAMKPLFTTALEEERAGLGFAVMQSFSDRVKVSSTPGKGTTVTLIKQLG